MRRWASAWARGTASGYGSAGQPDQVIKRRAGRTGVAGVLDDLPAASGPTIATIAVTGKKGAGGWWWPSVRESGEA